MIKMESKIKDKVLKGFKDDKWVLSGSDKSLISLGVDLTLAEVSKVIDDIMANHKCKDSMCEYCKSLRELKQKIGLK